MNLLARLCENHYAILSMATKLPHDSTRVSFIGYSAQSEAIIHFALYIIQVEDYTLAESTLCGEDKGRVCNARLV